MNTYVAMLRAINVSGKNKVSMPELERAFLGFGAQDVTTYLQSGNVVFRYAGDGPDDLEPTIERGISESLGLDVSVLLRTAGDFDRIRRANPFESGEPDATKLHVTFCVAAPGADRASELGRMHFDSDRLSILGREIYLHCPSGYGRTKLNNAFLERRLRVVATTRNWKSVTALAQLAADSSQLPAAKQ